MYEEHEMVMIRFEENDAFIMTDSQQSTSTRSYAKSSVNESSDS